MIFCSNCGAPVGLEVPDGDNRPRHVCSVCRVIHYVNPRMVVGVVCTLGDKLLLCRRAIEPRVGFWTFPAGFLEMGESAEEGAAREAMEEAGADVEIDRLLAVYSLAQLGQVHVFFSGQLRTPTYSCGAESLEVKLFSWDDLPWGDLAFATIDRALRQFQREVATVRS